MGDVILAEYVVHGGQYSTVSPDVWLVVLGSLIWDAGIHSPLCHAWSVYRRENP